MLWVAILLVILGLPVRAQPPAVFQEGVRNAASRIPPSLAGGAIARGSRFTIDGVRFGQSASEVRVEVGSVVARVLSVEPRRIEALLAGTAAPGETSLRVIRGQEGSRPFALRVAAGGMGLFSRNGRGWGPGRIEQVEADGRRVANSTAVSARPGQTVVIEGSGRADGPMTVLAGGAPARAISIAEAAGRPGIAEITVVLPASTPDGCWVPVTAITGGHAGNTVTIAVRRGGGACVAPAGWLRPNGPGQKSNGVLLLMRAFLHAEFTPGAPVDLIGDEGTGIFVEAAPGEDLLLPVDLAPPAGSCATFTGLYESGGMFFSSLLGLLFENVRGRGLDVGQGITLAGRKGTRTMPAAAGAPGSYGAILGGESAAQGPRTRPLFLDPGEYRVTAGGGQGIGEFALSLTAPEPFAWTNEGQIEEVDRARGVMVEWKGVGANEPVGVVAVNVDPVTTAAGVCFCVASGGRGRFHVPASALGNLPASQPRPGIPMSMLFVAVRPSTQAIRARGLDTGVAAMLVVRGKGVKYR